MILCACLEGGFILCKPGCNCDCHDAMKAAPGFPAPRQPEEKPLQLVDTTVPGTLAEAELRVMCESIAKNAKSWFAIGTTRMRKKMSNGYTVAVIITAPGQSKAK